MAQRELKVKVTADIDKSLTKLLDSIKKPIKVDVKVNTQKGDLNKVKKTLDSISKMKINPNVKVGVKTGDLDKVKKDLDKLENKKFSTTIDFKTNTDGLDGLKKEMEEIERDAEEASNTKISPIGVVAGLAPLASMLDQLSDKVLQLSNQVISPILGDTWKDATGLFDSQRSFELQMEAKGESPEWIAENMKQINEYGKQSKYSVAEMTDAFGQFYGSGKQNAWELVTGVAGIASYSKDASKAMASVNRQINQMTDDSKIFNGDWNIIQNAIGGVAAQTLKDWLKVNKGIEVTKKSLKEGELSAVDFQEAIRAVGNSNQFQVMATDVSTMSSAIDNFKESLTTALIGDISDPGPLRDVTQELVRIINDFTDEIPNFTKDISKGLEFLKKTFGDALKGFSAKDFIGDFKDSLKGSVPVIKAVAKLLALLTNNGKNLGGAIGNLIKWSVYWKMFRLGSKWVGASSTALGSLFKVVQKFTGLKFGLGGILGKIFGGGNSKAPDTKKIKGQALNTAKNIGTLVATVGAVWVAAKAMESISNMKISWGGLLNNLAAAGTGLTLAGGYIATIGFAMDKIKSLQEILVTGAVAVGGTALLLLGVTKAIEAVSKIKIDGNGLNDNLMSIGIAVTSATVAMTLIGTALTKFPMLGGGFVAGAAALTGAALLLVPIADAIDSVSKIKIDSDNLLKNLGSMALALTGATVFFGLIGGALNAFPPLIPALTAGVTAVLAVSAALVAISAAFEQTITNIVNTAGQFEKINIDSDKFQKGIDTMSAVLLGLTGFSLVAIPTGIVNFFGTLGTFAADLNVSALTNFAKKVSTFTTLEIPAAKTIKAKLKEIPGIFEALSKTNVTNSKGILDSFVNMFQGLFDSIGTANTIGQIQSLVDFVSKLNKMPEMDSVSLTEKVEQISNTVNALGKLNFDKDDVESVKNAAKALGSLNKIAEVFREMPTDIDWEGTNKAISDLTDALSQPYITNFKSAIKSLGAGELDVKGAVALIKAINTTATVFREIPSDIDWEKTSETISKLSEEIQKLSSKDGYNFKKAVESLGEGKPDLKGALALIEAINTIATAFRDVPADIDWEGTSEAISKITEEVKKLSDEKGYGFKQAVESLGKGKVDTDGAVALVTAITSIAEGLRAIPADIDFEATSQAITNIKAALDQINAEDGIKSTIASLAKDKVIDKFTNAVEMIGKITELSNALNAIPPVPDVSEKLGTIKTALEEIAGTQISEETVNAITSLVETVRGVITQLDLLTASFKTTGMSFAQALVDGFTAGKVEQIVTKVQQLIDKIKEKQDLNSIGKKMSDTLASGFNGDGLIAKINGIQSAIDSLKGKTVDITINETTVTSKKSKGKEKGGIIPEYHSTGGRVGGRLFKQRGTDTVPAMLTPGEYVLKRSVTNALGKGFLDALNKMNLSSAMAHLQNKVGNSNVVNNTYNTITQNVDNKASYLNGLSGIRRVVRS